MLSGCQTMPETMRGGCAGAALAKHIDANTHAVVITRITAREVRAGNALAIASACEPNPGD
ncbi:hypothetical protein YK56LOC_15090 [Caballeronia sp. HLA56]